MGDQDSINFKQKLEMLDILSEETNFQIFTMLNIFQEQTLTQLTDRISKSRATIHRHLQNLIDSELIYISNQEIKRGHIPANYYKVNYPKLLSIGQITVEDFNKMKPKEKSLFRSQIIQGTLTSSRIIQQNLKMLDDVLLKIDPKNAKDFDNFFNLETSPVFLNFGMMTSNQKSIFMKDFGLFMQNFQQKLIKGNLLELEEKKPHINFFGFLPIQKILHLKNME